jgi:uncharacterized protein
MAIITTSLRVLLAALIVLVFPPLSEAAFPAPQKYIVDGANVIDGAARQRLNALLRGLEDETSAEIAVVTVDSLDGMSVEEYANRLFKEWGIGKQGVANGVLVLVAPGDRKMRVEVGYGLEPVLPDGLAGAIIRNEFTPYFKNQDYAAGIDAGVRRIAEIVRAKHVLTPEERKRLEEAVQPGDRPPTLLTTPFFGLFIGIGALMIGGGLSSKTGFPLLFGSLFGGIPFLMSLIPFFNASPYVLVPWAIAAFVFGYRRAGSFFTETQMDLPKRRGKAARRFNGIYGSRNDGWTWGASSGGSSGSSSSGSS